MDDAEQGHWPARPAILAATGAVAAWAVQQLVDHTTPVEWRISLAVAIGTGALALGFVLERVRLTWCLTFAGVAAVTAGLIHHWSGGAPGWFDWRYPCLYVALAIAVPLFQTAREEGRARFPYPAVHDAAWTNAVLWFAACAFTGIVFLLAWLLSALFDLIGLHFLRQLLERGWFWAMLSGGAFGGALGLFRERDRVVRLLRRVVTAVLAVLAPVLAVGLALFLLALPFTGLAPLWQATRSTTPVLLSCVAGALLLANAVIGDGPTDEARNPLLRSAAAVLAATLLPLSLLAAVATGLRLHQYGATPDRLWALTFVAIACAYGLAYLVALARARAGWAEQARPANLRLAFAVAGVALLLATPLIPFNAIATRAQVARLLSGRVSPDRFDWAALGYDFGEPGRAALARLRRSANPVIAARARDAAAGGTRWAVAAATQQDRDADALRSRLRVMPRAVAVPAAMLKALTSWDACGSDDKARCTLHWSPGDTQAFTVRETCLKPEDRPPGTSPLVDATPACYLGRLTLDEGRWTAKGLGFVARDAMTPDQLAAVIAGRLEVRPVQRRQLAIGGRPVGDAFE